MPDFTAREMHLLKRALTVAVAALEDAPNTAFRPNSDIDGMKQLVGEIVPSDVELAMYTRQAHMALFGKAG